MKLFGKTLDKGMYNNTSEDICNMQDLTKVRNISKDTNTALKIV